MEDNNTMNLQTLCGPALRRLSERGGHSSLEELEAFIDAYFEMVWEQTMGSFQEDEAEPAGGGTREEEEEEEVLLSIDRKLSKLDLLEEIRNELSELRESLEHSWMTRHEVRDNKSQQEPSNT